MNTLNSSLKLLKFLKDKKDKDLEDLIKIEDPEIEKLKLLIK
jgi:hypothetical protein